MKKQKWLSKKKFSFILITIISIIILLLNYLSNEIKSITSSANPHQLFCLELPGNRLPELNLKEPKLGMGIFFHECSCHKDLTDISLNARQSCSIESALKAHPISDVFLLISSPIFTNLKDTKNVFVQELLKYPNFKLRHIKTSKYLYDTPLYDFYTSGMLNNSEWPVPHTSDLLRYATLYKFGGVYLDLDVFVLKPLSKLKNFAGAESNRFLASGILGFSEDKIGRQVAASCVEEFSKTYNPMVWGYNGPGVITRVMQRRCKTKYISQMIKRHCEGFKVYPKYYFSAISFEGAEIFFQDGNTKKVREITNQSYMIHYWNKMTSDYSLTDGSDIPFLKYAQEYCPNIYKAANGNFNPITTDF